MSNKRVLTGITTTGTPHLGNYVGAIRPAVAASKEPDVDAYLFLADYHALIKCHEPAQVAQSSLEIAACWLASGLDPDQSHFYRQSDIPEVTELTWILNCSAAKGLMNRAHAYKAAVQANDEAGEDPDFAITMGLFSYPVLMAADILIFNAHDGGQRGFKGDFNTNVVLGKLVLKQPQSGFNCGPHKHRLHSVR